MKESLSDSITQLILPAESGCLESLASVYIYIGCTNHFFINLQTAAGPMLVYLILKHCG